MSLHLRKISKLDSMDYLELIPKSQPIRPEKSLEISNSHCKPFYKTVAILKSWNSVLYLLHVAHSSTHSPVADTIQLVFRKEDPRLVLQKLVDRLSLTLLPKIYSLSFFIFNDAQSQNGEKFTKLMPETESRNSRDHEF